MNCYKNAINLSARLSVNLKSLLFCLQAFVGIFFCANNIFCITAIDIKALGLKESKNDFILQSPMISMVDGKSYGVDAQVFGLMLQNRREIRKRLLGLADSSSSDSSGTSEVSKGETKRVGYFDFMGTKYCIAELVIIEKELKSSDKDYATKQSALKECLIKAKEDFISMTKSYVKGVNNIKDPLLTLIEEFCEKKGIVNSYLLKWGEAEGGQEEHMIRRELTTFFDFAQFCIDLSDFLEVLAKSCPKGKALFVDMVKKAKSR